MDKKIFFIVLSFSLLLFSCQTEETIEQKKVVPTEENPMLVTITRSIGDGKDYLLGYGYNALYSSFDDYDGKRKAQVKSSVGA